MALATGGENQQIKWLASPAVQDMLVSTCKRMFMNSLQAERLAAEAKHWVGRNITRVGTISRELVCARYHKGRLERVRKLAEAERKLNAAKTTSRGSMAWLLSSDGDGVKAFAPLANGVILPPQAEQQPHMLQPHAPQETWQPQAPQAAAKM